ncbi:hypothetical protein LSTR_LSTR014765, partial [Laodelphax striatellus]
AVVNISAARQQSVSALTQLPLHFYPGRNMICQSAVSVLLVATFASVSSGYPYAHPHAFAYPYAHIPAYQQHHQQRQFSYPTAQAAALPFQQQQFPFAAPPATNYVYLAAPQQAHAQQPTRLVS